MIISSSDQVGVSDKTEPPASQFETGQLCLVSTPIGNMNDITLRAIDVLRRVNTILCEDTRVSSAIMKRYNIETPFESLHDYNEEKRIPVLLRRLKEGEHMALISDAGTPLLSDPGYKLVKAVIASGVSLTAIPGANAAILGLILSGFPPYPFLFMGFLPSRSVARKNMFRMLKATERVGMSATLICYESSRRLLNTLADLRAVFGDHRPAAVARELTKLFEEVKRGTLQQLYEECQRKTLKGEIVLVIGSDQTIKQDTLSFDETDIDEQLRKAMRLMSVRDAADMVSEAMQLSKKLVYQRAIIIKEKAFTGAKE